MERVESVASRPVDEVNEIWREVMEKKLDPGMFWTGWKLGQNNQALAGQVYVKVPGLLCAKYPDPRGSDKALTAGDCVVGGRARDEGVIREISDMLILKIRGMLASGKQAATRGRMTLYGLEEFLEELGRPNKIYLNIADFNSLMIRVVPIQRGLDDEGQYVVVMTTKVYPRHSRQGIIDLSETQIWDVT